MILVLVPGGYQLEAIRKRTKWDALMPTESETDAWYLDSGRFTGTRSLGGIDFETAKALLENKDIGEIYRLNHLAAPNYCCLCGMVYCMEHWNAVVRYDMGFFDCLEGQCPKGHHSTLDD